jgi:hypothetical protein
VANIPSSAHAKLLVKEKVDDHFELQRDPIKGKAIDLGIPISEITAGPKLMAGAQKTGYSCKHVDSKDSSLLDNEDERVQGLSGIEISSSGDDDFISDEAQGNQ